jgi:pyroglutamyl-peptidase
MHSRRPTILITGFGPFPTIAANATTVLVPRIVEAASRAFKGIAFPSEILPTEWASGVARAERLYHLHRPIVSLHFGVSSRATGFEIETRARNRCSRTQDAAGLLPSLDLLSPHGPEYLATTLPAAHIVDRLRRRGLPASLSRDAGGYLCNALLYRTLELNRDAAEAPRTGFVHLPASLLRPSHTGRAIAASPRMDWSDVVEGSLEIIAACLGRPSPAHPALGPGVRAHPAPLGFYSSHRM